MKILLVLIIGLLSSVFTSSKSIAQSCTDSRPMEEFFCLDTTMKTNSEITEVDFITIPYVILGLYQNDFKKLHQAVTLDLSWHSPYFGAGVTDFKNKYTIMILGGTARINEMSKNALAALVCHEIGHIIGGSPFQNMIGYEWSSAEGQSDFFAASECMPRYLKFLKIDESKFDDLIEEAGFDLFSALKWPSSMTRHESLERYKENDVVVKETLKGYPNIQCRYETFKNRYKRSSCWFKE